MSSTTANGNDVLHKQRGSSYWITINRPEKRNALHAGVIAGLREGIRRAHADLAMTEDAREGLTAFNEKRKPIWSGR